MVFIPRKYPDKTTLYEPAGKLATIRAFVLVPPATVSPDPPEFVKLTVLLPVNVGVAEA